MLKLTLATLALAMALPLAAEEGAWTGMLADAGCKQRTPDAACPVDSSTNMFGIVTSDGAFLPFDSNGNQKAAEAVKTAASEGNPTVSVSGSTDGSTVTVKQIKVT